MKINKRHKKRLIIIGLMAFTLVIAGGLILFALKQNINLFLTPSQIQAEHIPLGQTLKLGGYVQDDSVKFEDSGLVVHFSVTDRSEDIAVTYEGVLPNLFREGQTVVITGHFKEPDIFMADQVLAKHDETYVPPQLARKLKLIEEGA